jgi:hypothetical protein
MRHGRSWLVAAALAGCTDWNRPEPTELELEPPSPPSRFERTAAALGMVMPEAAGPDARIGGPTVWVMPDMVWFGPQEDAPLQPLVPVKAPDRGERLQRLTDFHPLYDAVATTLVGEGPFAIDVIVDGRVEARTLMVVLHWLARALVVKFHMIGGSPRAPRAVVMRDPFFMPSVWPPNEPPKEFKFDLEIKWTGADARAVIRPRRAGSPPLGEEREEAPPDSPHWRPSYATRVPVAVADGDPPLGATEIAGLVAELCRLNAEPFGVVLAATLELPAAALMSAAVAAVPEPHCRGGLMLDGAWPEPETRVAAIRVADLQAHVRASVRE